MQTSARATETKYMIIRWQQSGDASEEIQVCAEWCLLKPRVTDMVAIDPTIRRNSV